MNSHKTQQAKTLALLFVVWPETSKVCPCKYLIIQMNGRILLSILEDTHTHYIALFESWTYIELWSYVVGVICNNNT